MSRPHPATRTVGTVAAALAMAAAGCGTAALEHPPESIAGSLPASSGAIVGEAPPGSVRKGPTHYLLISTPTQEHAELLRMAEVNQRLAADGAREVEVVIVVIRSDDEAAQIRRAVAEINALRDAEGLAEIGIVDRRSP